jgi:5-methyltetrahydropteroyltriglutamate--homocysteine methyltransferase
LKLSDERILTTHAGSLPRGAELVRLYQARAEGEAVDAAELNDLGRDATRAVVQRQLDAGIDIGNNGEQQREGFFLHMQHRLSGFGSGWDRHTQQDVTRYPEFKRQRTEAMGGKASVSNFRPPTAVGPVTYAKPDLIEQECTAFDHSLQLAEGSFVETFMTAPSPGIVCTAMANRFYGSEETYLDAVAEAMKIEYETIAAHGYLLQLDCPDLALERHLKFQDRPLGEFLIFVESVVSALNRCLENIPRSQVRLHVCWGNYEGPHDCDVPLNDILPILLKADVGALVLPFANPRHAHEIKLLRTLPLAADQAIVAGVIDTLTNFVEHPEVVADRIERVADAVGDPRRVLACSDCGFDTSAGMGRVTSDIVWAKLAAMSAGAKIATERLF